MKEKKYITISVGEGLPETKIEEDETIIGSFGIIHTPILEVDNPFADPKFPGKIYPGFDH